MRCSIILRTHWQDKPTFIFLSRIADTPGPSPNSQQKTTIRRKTTYTYTRNKHKSSLKSTVVSATFVCRIALHANERAVSGHCYLLSGHCQDCWYLNGQYCSKRWYHRHLRVESHSTPAREQSPDIGISLDNTAASGNISDLRALS
jgi:hypothetical protein